MQFKRNRTADHAGCPVLLCSVAPEYGFGLPTHFIGLQGRHAFGLRSVVIGLQATLFGLHFDLVKLAKKAAH